MKQISTKLYLGVFILGIGFMMYSRYGVRFSNPFQNAAKAVSDTVTKKVNAVKNTVEDFFTFQSNNVLKAKRDFQKKMRELNQDLKALGDVADGYRDEGSEILSRIKSFFVETKNTLQHKAEGLPEDMMIEFFDRDEYEQSLIDIEKIKEQYQDNEKAKREALNIYAENQMINLMVRSAKKAVLAGMEEAWGIVDSDHEVVQKSSAKVWKLLEPFVVDYARSVFSGVDYYGAKKVAAPIKNPGAAIIDIMEPVAGA